VQENPVLVLLDLRGHFEAREDHGRGLGRGQGRVRERVRAERMVQDVGATGEQKPCGVREERRRRGAVAVESILDGLDIVFTIAPRAVEVFIHVLGGRRRSGRHDKPGIVTRRHDFGLDDHAPRLRP
jgi:hypothetical protein